MMSKAIFIFLPLILFFGCKQKERGTSTFIRFNSDSVFYTGRVNLETDSTAILYWPGTSVKLNFEGNDLKVLMQDSHGKNYYNVIIDDDSIFILHPDTIKTWYALAQRLPFGKHSIEIFKRTEWWYGPGYLYGFKTGENTRILSPPEHSKRTIEFFGNSITAGYAIEDTTDDSPDSLFTNNYLTYGALTARHYNANYYCTSRGGIGVTISWFPMIMDDLYYRLDPENPESKWDFSKVIPDIVVINLFQNDSWLVEKPDYPEFKHRFGTIKPTDSFIISKYRKFVEEVRKVYPKAKIVCTLGSMDATLEGSKWPGYIKTTVSQMNDPDIYTCFFPYMGKDGHPKVKDHKVMADTLIAFIDRNYLWN